MFHNDQFLALSFFFAMLLISPITNYKVILCADALLLICRFFLLQSLEQILSWVFSQ